MGILDFSDRQSRSNERRLIGKRKKDRHRLIFVSATALTRVYLRVKTLMFSAGICYIGKERRGRYLVLSNGKLNVLETKLYFNV